MWIFYEIGNKITQQKSPFVYFTSKFWKGLNFLCLFSLKFVLIIFPKYFLQHNINYVISAVVDGGFFIFVKLSNAYFPFFYGVLCRWKLYKFGLYLCCCDLKYRLILQYPFQCHRRYGQTNVKDYGEIPFRDLHLHLYKEISFLAKYLCGLRVCRFLLQKSYRFLSFSPPHNGAIFSENPL